MKIALVEPPLEGHKYRGIGTYFNNLVKALEKLSTVNFQLSTIKNIPENVDIVHFPYFDPFFLTLPIIKKKPTVTTVHDLTPIVFPDKFPPGIRGKIRWQIQKYSLRKSSAIITDSENSKRDIVRLTGFPKDKIFVVYLASAPEFRLIKDALLLRSIREKYHLPEKFVLYVGDVNYSKNISGLIKAFKRYTSEVSPRAELGGPSTSEVKLVLVGKAFKDERLKETREIIKLIEFLDLTKKVTRLGFLPIEDLAAIYNLAIIYVQPSFYEGFGLPVLEAMACGVPVVCARVASLPEVTGAAAILVDPKNEEEIMAAINKVLSLSPRERQEMAKKSLTQAKKFSWEKTTQKTLEVYKKVIG